VTLIERLRDLLGSTGIISEPAEISPYLSAERDLYQGTAACVVLPRTTEEFAELVRLCRAEGYAVVPQGGNTGGLAVLRYGTAGELALGLEVVLPSGDILDCLTPLRKDNTGYDLKSLFLGAEGTLGIITAAVLKLFPAPTEHQTAWLALPDTESVCRLLALARTLSSDTEYISQASLQLVSEHIDGIQCPFKEEYPHQVLMELSGPLVVESLRPTVESILLHFKDDTALQLMRTLKKALDPDDMMNPGNRSAQTGAAELPDLAPGMPTLVRPTRKALWPVTNVARPAVQLCSP
jgi:FAD/FMN-containing dehydrogenase